MTDSWQGPLFGEKIEGIDWVASGQRLRLDPSLEGFLDKRVYRYASIAEALQLARGQMTFASPTTWPDKYESHVIEELFLPPGPFSEAVPLIKCCSLEYASEAMWRTYSGAGGLVRVSIKLIDLLGALRAAAQQANTKIYVGRMRYMDQATLRNEVERIASADTKRSMNHAMPALLAKRSGFSFENEIRIAFLPGAKRGRPNTETLKAFPGKKIEGILLDPYLPEWQANVLVKVFKGYVHEKCRVRQSMFNTHPRAFRANFDDAA